MTSNGIIFKPNFKKISHLVQNLKWGEGGLQTESTVSKERMLPKKDLRKTQNGLTRLGMVGMTTVPHLCIRFY